MKEVWIIDAARSPRGLGRADRGSLAKVHPQRLLSQTLHALQVRNNLQTDDIEHVIIGCAN
ncbi:MAG: acetyl-CoA C-acyltransferase, partial [Pseudomonadales bacterium]|nr:acetyl-CoA C-acyltransferase [Pseudomonadales bacterium]